MVEVEGVLFSAMRALKLATMRTHAREFLQREGRQSWATPPSAKIAESLLRRAWDDFLRQTQSLGEVIALELGLGEHPLWKAAVAAGRERQRVAYAEVFHEVLGEPRERFD